MHHQSTTSPRQEAQPLVSFIIPYYDLPVVMLCECIDSILAAPLTAAEREIIVIDDGSSTSPMNGLMHYGDDIIYLRQPNQGLGSARNKGIEVATGQYLQFVDGDDRLVPDAYAHCLDLLRNHPDADMIVFDFTDGQPAPQSYTDSAPLSGTEYLRHHNIHGMACGYIARAKTVSELRFTPGIYHEDEEFTPLLLVRAERIVRTDARAYHYRRRPDSITTAPDATATKKRLDDLHGVIQRLHYQADRLGRNDRLAMQRRVAQLTMDYIYQTIRQSRSADVLEQRVSQLRAEGLFPLPRRSYSSKYTWFRLATLTALGRRLLLLTLPLMKKER